MREKSDFSPVFSSRLAPVFSRYIDLKRSLGRGFNLPSRTLQSLDRFLYEHSANRHFSQGSIFSVNGGAKPVWRVVSWQGVDLEAGQRLRGGAFSASKLDLGHSSASSFARAKWKGLFG